MGRPSLEVGTWGDISCRPHGPGFRASARFRDFDGVVRAVTRQADTESKAKAALRKALRDRVTAHRGGDGIDGNSRVDELAAVWLESISRDDRLSERTVAYYSKQVRNHVVPMYGGLKLSEVTGARVDRGLSALAVESPATAKAVRGCLSGMMRLAVRRDAVKVNPVAGVTRITTKARKGPARALTDGEADALFAALDADPRAHELDLVDLCRFLDGTGCRIGEALALTEERVGDGVVEIAATTHGSRIVERTKTDAGHRVIAVPPHVSALLARRIGDDTVPTGVALFASPMGRVRDASNTSNRLREVFDVAGFEWVTSHTFRKTVATRLDLAGMSARAIADHLGHSKPSMTQDVYMGRKVANSAAADVLTRG